MGRSRPRQLGPRPRHLVGAGARLPRRRRAGAPAVDRRRQAARRTTSTSAPRLAPLRDAGRAGRGQRQRRAQPAAWSTSARPDGASTGPTASTTPPASCSPPTRARSPGCSSTPTTAAPSPPPTTSCRWCTSPAWPPPPGTTLDVLIDGYDAGSLSMTSYTLGIVDPRDHDPGRRGRGAPPQQRPAPTPPTSDRPSAT